MDPASTTPSAFERPFPALTPAQRYRLDVMGYVIVPDVLSREECGLVAEALQKIKRDLQSPRQRRPQEPYASINLPHHTYVGGLLEGDPCLAALATHPTLAGLAEELIGGEARLVEYDAHINSRVPGADLATPPTFGFHRGTDVPFSSHAMHGLYHCSFVKTLTMLTDVGPNDGGTVVIAGSHKLAGNDAEVNACAYADRSLIHSVVAPAGATLLFDETLVHATGQVRSDRERVIVINGYGASMFPHWNRCGMSEAFRAKVPERFRTLLLGKAHWTRGARYRTLTQPADTRRFTLKDGWWPGASP
ncbi:MAG: phytanoyl-CoA dioxygenase family protein [Planctomycetota bacterium]|nr:phytanoyl-CoA dioxygenase family protein [Planctomycetota bacterium]